MFYIYKLFKKVIHKLFLLKRCIGLKLKRCDWFEIPDKCFVQIRLEFSLQIKPRRVLEPN